jgi:parallel beta helix pectate lyase-like protein
MNPPQKMRIRVFDHSRGSAMTRIVFLPLGLAAALTAVLPCSRAEAQNVRTYVRANGGSPPCLITSPCATLQAAHNDTQAGGEVLCLEPGPVAVVGAMTIDRSITIDCRGSSRDIIVNAADITVTLRNLTLSSLNVPAETGIGIDFRNGAALFLENCVIENWNAAATGPGIGVKFSPPAGVAAKLHVTDCVVRNNGLAASGGGIIVQPAGSGSVRALVERTKVENNTYGIFANGMNATGTIIVQIKDSVVANNARNGISAFTAAGRSTTSITVDRSSSLLNGADGILAQGPTGFVILGNSTVMSNTTGLHSVDSGTIFSYQNNQLTGNATNGAPTGVLTQN